MTPTKNFGARWKPHLHYHLVLISLIVAEHFMCGGVSYRDGADDEKLVQNSPHHKFTRSMFQAGGKLSTWFPPVRLVNL